MPKLSELDPSKIELVSESVSTPSEGPLKLSSLKQEDIQILPSEPVGPTKTESFAKGLQQGATLGFADETVAGIDALAETVRESLPSFLGGSESTLAPGKGIKEKYKSSLEQQRGLVQQAEKANPLTSLGGQLVGGIPSALASGGGSYLAQSGISGGLAGAQSLGEAEKIDLEALKTAGKAAGWSALFTGLLNTGMKVVKGVLKTPSGAFKLSEELKQSIADPEVAKKIGQEIDSTGSRLKDVVFQSKNAVGEQLDNIASKVETPVNPEGAFNKALSSLNSFKTGRNELASNTKADLVDTLMGYSDELAKAHNGKIDAVSFKALHQAKQQLGDEIFNQKRFSDNSYVEKVAKGFYKDLSETLKKADPSKEYGTLNKVYQGLSSTDPDAFSTKALEYLENPFNSSVRKAFSRVTGDVTSLPPAMQEKYLGPLKNFLETDFAKSATKQQLLTSVGNSAPVFVRGGGLMESIAGSVKSAVPRGASSAGAAYGKVPEVVKQGVKVGAGTLEGLGRSAGIKVGVSLQDIGSERKR